MHEPDKKADDGDGGGGDVSSQPDGPLITVPLSAIHRTASFLCQRNARIQTFMRQDCRRLERLNFARVFVLPSRDDPAEIWGYYTLASNIVQREDMRASTHKQLLPSSAVPVAQIACIGRSDSAPKGLGGALINDAAKRVARSDIAHWGLALTADNADLVKWFSTLGFYTAKTLPLFMYGPVKAFLPAVPRNE